ncbi:hypothetical protein SAMN05660461_2941 [Chitinophaga ginsengisegetis]|uniref:Uncharacterized protein n=1 Tax=Chitinophaga ginsengisegetis TaxID=393003 RepID=A0A1T5NWI5_9BACT|nr:hypothetical protein [Chitinophaga ginsengisegetis]SKD04830.1 hypothetical protein SAMN05660461_2941 [Chitinophaga ginsengisegetis]
MSRRKTRSGFYQTLKQGWKVGELSAYEEHLPADFFETVGRRAAINAINENRAMNLPVTLMRNGKVMREMPDGKQEVISEIHLISSEQYQVRNLVKGAVIHVGKKR